METPPQETGTLIKGIGGFYYALTKNGDVKVLRAKGAFRKRGITPLIGDEIILQAGKDEQHGWIMDILERKNQLIRPPVANISYIVIVISPIPSPDYLLVDTLLIMAFKQNIKPIIIVNKCDLDSNLFNKVNEMYKKTNIPVLAVSAYTGQGIDELVPLLKEGIICFAGQSGVGKSTLLSKSTGLTLQTGEISKRNARGKHTTRHAELLIKDDFKVLDTPGFSLIELKSSILPNELQNYYPEFTPYLNECKFSPCYHLCEPGCKILKEQQNGNIHPERLSRYHHLLKQIQEGWKKRYD